MRKKELFKRPISWIVFALLAAAGIIYTCNNFDKANSLVNVNLQMDRQSALLKAEQLAEKFEIGPKNYKQAAAFRNDSHFQNFVELEAGGLDTFKNILTGGYYSSYHWSVRHFKEQDANEVIFWFKPNGETYGFSEKIPESEKGETVEQEEALRIAEHLAIYNWDVDLTPYQLIEKSTEEQISGRADHTFVYERTDKTIGEGKFRLKLIISGNKLTTVDYHVKIPEDFDRRFSEMRSANETIQMISTAAIALVYGLLGVILGIFVLMRKRRLIWKPAVFWGLGIAFFSVFLLTINSLPFAWFSYDTSMSEGNFLFRQILNGLLGAIGFGALIGISFMAAEGLGRMAFPKHVQWWKIWSKNTAGSHTILAQTIAGYLFAIIIVSFDVFFYVTTTTHFGWWSPAGNLSNPNILATYLPWLDSIAISLQAGFWEEALFRAVPIAGIYVLAKNKKSRNFWIILVLIVQTLIFGAGHANYPQQPSYARVVEMIIPFAIMGIIYIYYGILPAVIAHFAVDVFWISLPLWVSSSPGIWYDRSFVVFFFLLPIFIILFIRFRNKKWKKIPDEERNSGWQVPEKHVKTDEPEMVIEVSSKNYGKWILPLSIIGLVAWIFLTPFKTDSPILELSKKEAIEIAKTELSKKYDLQLSEWTILSSVEDKVDIRDIFVWQVGNKEIYQKLLNDFLAPPHWKIRFVKTKGKAEEKTEEYIIQVLNDKSVLAIAHKIPDAAVGKNLEKHEAQIIADSVLVSYFMFQKETLKEISISPKKQENRTDWEFIYADTINFPLTAGQGRYLINISGDEITSYHSYLHIPEEWTRNYKEKISKQSVVKTLGNIVIIGVIIFGLVLGIIRWTKKKFNIKVFVIVSVLFALFFILEIGIGWQNLLSDYNTQIPISNYLTNLIVGLSISGIFFSLFNGIFVAATPGWLPVRNNSEKYNLLKSVGLGLFIAAILVAVQSLVPKTQPSWLEYSYLNSNIPFAGVAFSKISDILIYPAFASVLFLGIHWLTKSWTTQKWIGIVFSVLAGLSLMALSFENYTIWLVSGTVLAIGILAIYIFFIRFHFEWIPVSFGILLLFKMIKEMVIIKNQTIIEGGILMIAIAFLMFFCWYKLLLKNSFQKR